VETVFTRAPPTAALVCLLQAGLRARGWIDGLSGPIAFPRRVTQWHCDGAVNRLPLRGQRRNCGYSENSTHRLPVSFLGRMPLEHLKRCGLYRRGRWLSTCLVEPEFLLSGIVDARFIPKLLICIQRRGGCGRVSVDHTNLAIDDKARSQGHCGLRACSRA
jgi:hypothetical protein